MGFCSTKNDLCATYFDDPLWSVFSIHKIMSLSKLHQHTSFNKLDKNGDGLVSLDELMWLLEKIGVCADREELKLLIGKDTLDPVEFLFFYETLTTNGNNDDNIREICEVEEKGGVLETDLRKAFRVFDLNDDGLISCEELEIALAKLGLWDECHGGDCKSMIGVYDVNKDGVLDFEEFKDMLLA